MHTKTISIKTDWLSEIDGMTVMQAILYLKQLDSNLVLSYNMEGDTHGCSVESELLKTEPMTNNEILAQIDARYQKQIKHYQDAKKYYTDKGQTDRLDNCNKQIAQINDKWEAHRAEYKA